MRIDGTASKNLIVNYMCELACTVRNELRCTCKLVLVWQVVDGHDVIGQDGMHGAIHPKIFMRSCTEVMVSKLLDSRRTVYWF